MSHPGPHYPLSRPLDNCAQCSRHVKTTLTLGIKAVGNYGAIYYTLCAKCIKIHDKPLSPVLQCQLDARIMKRAVELGLDQGPPRRTR